MRDIFALVSANEPISEDRETGDKVNVSSEERLERYQDFGWVTEESSRTETGYVTDLTPTGAAILNYFAHALGEGDIAADIEQGVSTFIDNALRFQRSELDPEEWEIVEISEDDLVLQSGQVRRLYTMIEEEVVDDEEELEA